MAVFSFMSIRGLATQQVTDSGLSTARAISTQVREMRGYYTKNVVGKAKQNGLKISHDHIVGDDSIPLPATLTHEINKNIKLFKKHMKQKF